MVAFSSCVYTAFVIGCTAVSYGRGSICTRLTNLCIRPLDSYFYVCFVDICLLVHVGNLSIEVILKFNSNLLKLTICVTVLYNLRKVRSHDSVPSVVKTLLMTNALCFVQGRSCIINARCKQDGSYSLRGLCYFFVPLL